MTPTPTSSPSPPRQAENRAESRVSDPTSLQPTPAACRGTWTLTRSPGCRPWLSSRPPLSSGHSSQRVGKACLLGLPWGIPLESSMRSYNPTAVLLRNGSAKQGGASPTGLPLPTVTPCSPPGFEPPDAGRSPVPLLQDRGKASHLTLEYDNMIYCSRFMRFSLKTNYLARLGKQPFQEPVHTPS